MSQSRFSAEHECVSPRKNAEGHSNKQALPESPRSSRIRETNRKLGESVQFYRKCAFHETRKREYARSQKRKRPSRHEYYSLPLDSTRSPDEQKSLCALKRKFNARHPPIKRHKVNSTGVWSRTPSPPRSTLAEMQAKCHGFCCGRALMKQQVFEEWHFHSLANELADINEAHSQFLQSEEESNGDSDNVGEYEEESESF